MKISSIYFGAFAITTLAMALVLHTVSELGLPWRDALIIGSVFGGLVPLTLWRWQEDRRRNRQMWNTLLFLLGRR
jgi:hypothetical protein